MTVPLPPDASFGACVRESPLWRIFRAQARNVRPCNGICHHSHLVVVTDSQLFLSTHSQGQAAWLDNDVCEPLRYDVRLSEGVQLVLTSVGIHVDGKIATRIEGLRKIGDIRANHLRPRRVDETASTGHGCNEGAGIRHVTSKDAFGYIAGNSSQSLAGLRDVPNEASYIYVLFLEGLVDHRTLSCPWSQRRRQRPKPKRDTEPSRTW